MNLFSWTLNSWYICFQVVSLLLLAGTVITGIGALITGYALNSRQSKEIELLKTNRVEMEKSLARREIMLVGNAETSNVDGLKVFGGTNVKIRCLSDGEATRAAQNIAGLVAAANWNVTNPIERGDDDNALLESFWDGVVVEPHTRADFEREPTNEELADEAKSVAACDALVRLLVSNNWVARTNHWPRDSKAIPSNTIRVSVGFKPTPNVVTQQMKDWTESMQRSRREKEAR